MKKNRDAVQRDLFEKPEEDLRRKVRELDRLIAGALKRKEYDKAKSLTSRQEELIRTLVENTEETNTGTGKKRP